jgi:hypothetical protein
MNRQQFEIAEGDRVRLRAIVATIDRELSGLSREAPPADRHQSESVLKASWGELVELLALGVAPEVRECPACQHLCRWNATLCGHCWAKLTPLAPPAAAATGQVAAVSPGLGLTA